MLGRFRYARGACLIRCWDFLGMMLERWDVMLELFGYALGARWLRCWGFLDMMVGRLDAMLGRFGYLVEAFAYDVRVVWMRSWGFWGAMRGSLQYEVGAFWVRCWGSSSAMFAHLCKRQLTIRSPLRSATVRACNCDANSFGAQHVCDLNAACNSRAKGEIAHALRTSHAPGQSSRARTARFHALLRTTERRP